MLIEQVYRFKEKIMKLPKQYAPVIRLAAPSAKSTKGGVEASGWFDDVMDVVQVAAPIALSLL